MKLIPEKEVEEVSKSNRWFESIGTLSSDYQLGFINGSNWTQSRLMQLMVDYALWWKENVRNAEIPHHYCIKGQWTICYEKEHVLEQYLKLKL